MIVINEPHKDPKHGQNMRAFAEAFGADELDFERSYDSVVLRKGKKAFRLTANSNQGYEFLFVERVV